MRVLLDECLPRGLRVLISGHDVQTVPGAGWAGRTNGELLRLAASSFDVFITMDQNLVHQQNLKSAPLAILVLVAPSNRLDALRHLVPEIRDEIPRAERGRVTRIGAPRS